MFATDYYCDPVNGKVANDGSLLHPWKTLQEVMESNKTFVGGDNIFLLNGNHGKVILNGIFDKYVTIQAYENHKPLITSLKIGENVPAMRWRISDVNLGGISEDNSPIISISAQCKLIQILYCNISTVENSTSWTKDNWSKNARNAMQIDGERHKILFNRIRNVKNGIINQSQQSNFQNNSINYFTENGIQTNGNSCVFENNLIKNSVNLCQGSTAAFIFIPTKNKTAENLSIIKQNTLRGNIIYNYTRYDRKLTGALMGIVSFDNVLDMCVFENNLVVCDHWHGLSLFNINNCTVVNNTIADPYLGTLYPDETRKDYLVPIGPARLWLENKMDSLGGNTVCNNLVSATIFKGINGSVENNPTFGSTYSDLDETFLNWEYLDFRLKPLSPNVNAGLENISPAVDAFGMPRKTDNLTNAGALEYSKMAVGERDIEIKAEKTDVELQSNGIKNWNGQPNMRLGGAGDVFNSNAIIPFILPAKKSNEKISQASFTFQLELIQNAPEGSVDMYGLLPRVGNEVQFADYYEGESNKASLARLIQAGIFDGNSATGKIQTGKTANINLADYINSLYEAGYKAGDQFFIRLNHNKTNIAKYSRWQIASANAELVDSRPKIDIKITPVSNANENTILLLPTVYVYPSPSILGDYTISIVNNSNLEKLNFSIKKMDGSVCYEYQADGTLKDLKMSGKYNLISGYYMMSFKFGNGEERIMNFNIW
jgi:hypothetical protein